MLRGVSALSLVYDVSIGLALFFLRPQLEAWFGVPTAQPPIHVDLNAVFVTAVGVGYGLPLGDPVRYRAYLWLFGVALKGAGAAAFLADYWLRGSPALFLLFAASDALVAGLTFTALRFSPAKPPEQRNA